MTTQAIKLQKGFFVINNRTISKHTAKRKSHKCIECGGLIDIGKEYYSATINGAGVNGFVHPDYIHKHCINGYLNFIKK